MYFQASRTLAAALLVAAATVATEAKAQCTTCFYPAPTVVGFQAGYSVRPTLFGRGWRIKPYVAPVVAAPAVVPVQVVPMQLQAVPQTYYRYQWVPATTAPAQPTPAAQPGTTTSEREKSILVRPSARLRMVNL